MFCLRIPLLSKVAPNLSGEGPRFWREGSLAVCSAVCGRGRGNWMGGVVGDTLVRRFGLRAGRRIAGSFGLGSAALFMAAAISVNGRVTAVVFLSLVILRNHLPSSERLRRLSGYRPPARRNRDWVHEHRRSSGRGGIVRFVWVPCGAARELHSTLDSDGGSARHRRIPLAAVRCNATSLRRTARRGRRSGVLTVCDKTIPIL